MNKLRILYHHRTQGRGGEGVHIREVVMALRELGCIVQMQEAPGVDALNAEETRDQKNTDIASRPLVSRVFKYLSLRAPQFLFELAELAYNLWALFPLSGKLRNGGVDVFYERYAFFSYIGTSLAHRYNVPSVLEVNEIAGIERARNQAMPSLAKYIEKKVFQKADRILVVSSYLKQALVARGVNEAKIHVIPNAVRSDSLAGTGHPGKTIRQELKLGDRTVVGFLGQIVRWDRLDLLLEDMVDFPGVHLLVVGPCRFMDELLHKVDELSLRHTVTFTGAVERDQVHAYIDAMDICVLPHSNPFGSPIVMFEYMARRKPVLAVDVGPVTDVIENDVNGCLFADGDRSEFRNKLTQLVENPELRLRIGNAGFDTVKMHHTWSRNAEQILEILRGLKEIQGS